MAVTATPIFIQSGFAAANYALLDAVDNKRDGSGTYDTIVTGATNGSLLHGIQFRAVTATQNTRILIFQSSGGTERFLDEIAVEQISPTEDTPAWVGIWRPPGYFILPSSDLIVASIYSGSGMAFHCFPLGGNL